MNTCSHCRMDVPTAATTCPYCLENPYDGAGFNFMVRIFDWLFQAALIIIVLFWIFG